MRVLVTGASGVLGSAVYAKLKADNTNTVLGIAHSRPSGEIISLDLLDAPAVERTFSEFKPDWIIHCAAERRPDVAEKNPEGTQKLNAELPASLAALGAKLGARLVYISTDYVFDGTSPPYAPDALPNPVNLYGRTKRAGEEAVLAARAQTGADAVVLRVPVLYGPAPNNADTAVNILIDVVLDSSGKTYKMDHYATRYPTNVVDIAVFLNRLIEPFTKYEMCLIFARLLHIPSPPAHIIPDDAEPTGAAATARPRDCRLDVSATETLLGGPGSVEYSLFDEWWAERFRVLGLPKGSGAAS